MNQTPNDSILEIAKTLSGHDLIAYAATNTRIKAIIAPLWEHHFNTRFIGEGKPAQLSYQQAFIKRDAISKQAKQNNPSLEDAPSTLANDTAFVLEKVKAEPEKIKYVSDRLLENTHFIQIMRKHDIEGIHNELTTLHDLKRTLIVLSQSPLGRRLLNDMNNRAAIDTQFTRQAQAIYIAMTLVWHHEGRVLLNANLPDLANIINSTTLNHKIKEGPDRDVSVALLLASTQEGLALLTANNYHLASLITHEILNLVIPQGAYQGYSVTSELESTEVGRGVFIMIKNQHQTNLGLFSILSKRPHDGEDNNEQNKRGAALS